MYQNSGEDYSDDDSTEKVLKKNKRAALVAKWNEQSEQLQSTGSHIYVLSLETICHDGDGGPDLEVVGVYNSKAAAVAKSVTVTTIYGRFDSAIKDMFSEDDGGHEDNRENPPNNGVLIQLGHEDSGEGDICRLLIRKCPVVGIESEPQGKNKRGMEAVGVDSEINPRKQKKEKDEVILLDDSEED